MKLKFLTIFAALMLALAQAGAAPLSERDYATEILKCEEQGPNAEASFEVISKYSQLHYQDGSASIQLSERTIIIDTKTLRAESKQVGSLYGDDGRQQYSGKDGTRYENLGPQTDAKGRKYPSEFLNLRARLSADRRSDKNFPRAITHLSANVVLPESRVRTSQKPFEATAYLNYWLDGDLQWENTPGNADGTLIGLARLTCRQTYAEAK